MKNQKISSIDTYLVETAVKGKFSDSTRKVETIGFVVVDIATDEGLHGLGVTYNEVGGEAVKEMIDKALAPKLLGRDPLATETLYEETFHYMRGVGRKGLAFCAYSPIDLALWDIKGKLLGLPLYRLLGGSRREVPIYGSGGWVSYSKDELVEEARGMVAQGYKHIKVKVGVNGGKDLREDVRRIAAVREAVGPAIGIMLDANNAFTSATAVQLANRLREYDILFFEEPVLADDLPGLARFRQGTDIPLATGEHEYTRYGVRDLLLNQAVDVLQVDITRSGGFTEMLKVAALAQTWNVGFAPHGMEHMHMHLVAALPNAMFLERLLVFEPVAEIAFKNSPLPKNGMLTLPDEPGLGLTLNYDNLPRARK